MFNVNLYFLFSLWSIHIQFSCGSCLLKKTANCACLSYAFGSFYFGFCWSFTRFQSQLHSLFTVVRHGIAKRFGNQYFAIGCENNAFNWIIYRFRNRTFSAVFLQKGSRIKKIDTQHFFTLINHYFFLYRMCFGRIIIWNLQVKNSSSCRYNLINCALFWQYCSVLSFDKKKNKIEFTLITPISKSE